MKISPIHIKCCFFLMKYPIQIKQFISFKLNCKSKNYVLSIKLKLMQFSNQKNLLHKNGVRSMNKRRHFHTFNTHLSHRTTCESCASVHVSLSIELSTWWVLKRSYFLEKNRKYSESICLIHFKSFQEFFVRWGKWITVTSLMIFGDNLQMISVFRNW